MGATPIRPLNRGKDMIMIDPSMVSDGVLGVQVAYEVQIESNGSKAMHHQKGVWFQSAPFIANEYVSVDDAIDAIDTWRSDSNARYTWAPARIVQITRIVNVVRVVE
jgi:hypothetical protein